VYAEDPDAGFLPSPDRITALRIPSGPGIRDDGWAETGTDVPIFYDPLISKLVAWGESRPQAIARMRRALMEYEVRGIRTSLPFFRWMMQQPAFLDAEFHTEFLDELLQRRSGEGFGEIDPSLEEVAAIAACITDRDEPPRAESAPSRRTAPGARLDGRTRTWKDHARVEGLRG
jgi:acetyl/propionyl-CoA carboxylase alpha subunit